MGTRLETRFARYDEAIADTLGHADRAVPATWYLPGLMLPGGRKSVEPMAARMRPQDARSTHQSIHHLASTSDWSDEALLTTVAEQVPRGVVLGDAADGDGSALRDELSEQGLIYALGIRPLTAVWWATHQAAPPPPPAAHSPISVGDLAQALPAQAYRTIRWRQGSAEPLSGRLARVCVVTAHDDRARNPEWLVIAAYGFLTLERLRGSKKIRARFKAPAVPEGFRPRGARADAAASAVLDRDRALWSRLRDRSTPVTMSLLRQGASKHRTCLVAQ